MHELRKIGIATIVGLITIAIIVVMSLIFDNEGQQTFKNQKISPNSAISAIPDTHHVHTIATIRFPDGRIGEIESYVDYPSPKDTVIRKSILKMFSTTDEFVNSALLPQIQDILVLLTRVYDSNNSIQSNIELLNTTFSLLRPQYREKFGEYFTNFKILKISFNKSYDTVVLDKKLV